MNCAADECGDSPDPFEDWLITYPEPVAFLKYRIEHVPYWSSNEPTPIQHPLHDRDDLDSPGREDERVYSETASE